MTTIEIDLANIVNETQITVLKAVYNVQLSLITKNGPCGNPLYSVTGNVEDLREFLTKFYYEGDEEEAVLIQDEINEMYPELTVQA